MHISAQLIQSYPREYAWWSCGKENLSIPLEAHHKAQLSDIFLSFPGKKSKRAVIFLFFGQSCWNCIFKLLGWTAFEQCKTCPSAAKKGCGSHLFGVGPSEADKIALVQELSKATSFFILGPILVKFHIRTRLSESFLMMYRFWKCSQEKLHFTPIHTLRQLMHDEVLFPPLRRVVEFRARHC